MILGGHASGQRRVNRGGSWNNTSRNCRSAYRNANEPSNRNNNLGFRVCLAPSPTVGSGESGMSVGPRVLLSVVSAAAKTTRNPSVGSPPDGGVEGWRAPFFISLPMREYSSGADPS